MKTIDILRKYTAGEMTLEETNVALEGKGFHLEPGKNILTEEDKRATTIGYYPDQANGWGLLDSGTGTLDKVQIVNGKLANSMGEAFAIVFIGGKSYEVKGDTLT